MKISFGGRIVVAIALLVGTVLVGALGAATKGFHWLLTMLSQGKLSPAQIRKATLVFAAGLVGVVVWFASRPLETASGEEG